MAASLFIDVDVDSGEEQQQQLPLVRIVQRGNSPHDVRGIISDIRESAQAIYLSLFEPCDGGNRASNNKGNKLASFIETMDIYISTSAVYNDIMLDDFKRGLCRYLRMDSKGKIEIVGNVWRAMAHLRLSTDETIAKDLEILAMYVTNLFWSVGMADLMGRKGFVPALRHTPGNGAAQSVAYLFDKIDIYKTMTLFLLQLSHAYVNVRSMKAGHKAENSGDSVLPSPKRQRVTTDN